MRLAIYAMLYLGSALMVYNIYGFIRFRRYIKGRKSWGARNYLLNLPIALLVLFLLGYLTVALFGKPDLVVAGILFGGSVFVFVMYRMLRSVTLQIVESEHMEAELMAAEESNRVKSRLLASISHEMRTPLNVIMGLDRMALNDPNLPFQTRDQLEKIGHSADHLLDLINDALDLQRIEKGGFTLREEPFSLNDQLDQIDIIVRAQSRQKGQEFVLEVGPAAEGDYLGDATQLKRALLCILDNAVKFTPPCGLIRFDVDCVSREGDTRTLRFKIADTGVGIDEAFLPKLYEAFSQEDASSTSRFGGSGVGLTIAKSVVDSMGGAIDVVSEKDSGTTFTVTVPLKVAPRPAEDGEDEGIDSLEGRRILIVDDIPENAEIAADLLELEDALTEQAENGQAALDMFEASEEYWYDAVLMDMRMPGMDGLEAARRIRALDRPDARDVPIIALSANAFDEDVQNALDAGMDAHLGKPVDADKLYAALKRYIPIDRPTKEGKGS
ncbi:MAG: response regulator [Clostridia bacterium]|nr:response regulator [Clostridia bacterium]